MMNRYSKVRLGEKAKVKGEGEHRGLRMEDRGLKMED